MANKKNETKIANEVAEETNETVASVEVAEEEFVTIKLPKDRNSNGSDSEYVSVNDRTWQIKRGVEVKVPACVAEVLANREKQLDAAYDYRASVENKD